MIKRLSASHGTGPLFHKIMDLAHLHRNPSWVTRPETIETSRVCALSGLKPGKFCSTTRAEYHIKGQAPIHECNIHKSIVIENCNGEKKVITYVQLPKEYAEWSKSSQVPTLENQLKEICGIKDPHEFALQQNSDNLSLVEPLDHTTYAIDPTIPLSHQEIRFALRNSGSISGIQIYANDLPIEVKVEENEFYWPLQKGQFKFYLKKGDLVSNAVNIEVR